MSEPTIETFYIAAADDERTCNCCGQRVNGDVIADVDLEANEAIHEKCISEESDDE